VQNIELSFSGAVDPYFNGEAHIIYLIDPVVGDTRVELEEAFLTTQALPLGLQLKGGFFFTEFGIINPTHPHAWDWLDQPVINTRLFGPDGLRQAGMRLGWLTPLPWYSEVQVGVQNANGETASSFFANEEFFEERPIGGRPFVAQDVRNLGDLLYLARWVNSWNLSDTVTTKAGFSGLYGPNATGPDGDTWIYGADLKLTWRPTNNFRGWPFFLGAEAMKRDYRADRFFDDSDPETSSTCARRSGTGVLHAVVVRVPYGWAAGSATSMPRERRKRLSRRRRMTRSGTTAPGLAPARLASVGVFQAPAAIQLRPRGSPRTERCSLGLAGGRVPLWRPPGSQVLENRRSDMVRITERTPKLLVSGFLLISLLLAGPCLPRSADRFRPVPPFPNLGASSERWVVIASRSPYSPRGRKTRTSSRPNPASSGR
jgi:hypothetical protein